MSWVELKFSISGDTQVSRAFEISARHAEDMSEPLGEIGEQILTSVGEQFATEGSHSGAPWKPLSPRYAAWKMAHGGARPILVFSARMRGMMTSRRALHVTKQRLLYMPTDPGGEGEDRAQVAAWHQAGSGHNPQRKMVDLTQAEKRMWERSFLTWMRRDPLFAGSKL